MNQLLFLYMTLRDFLEPIHRSFSSLEELEYLFYGYGWDISLTEDDFLKIGERLSISVPLEQFLQEADTLEATLVNENQEFPGFDQVEPLAVAALNLFKALADLKLSDLSNLAEPLNKTTFWSDIGDHLLDDLLEKFLRVYYSSGYLFLHLFGVIRYDLVEPAGDHRRPYIRTRVDWDQLVEILKNPLSAFKKTYHWGDPANDFQHQRLLSVLHKVFRAVGVRAALGAPDAAKVAGIPENAGLHVKKDEGALQIHFLYSLSDLNVTVYEIGIEVLPAVLAPQTQASGLVIRPILRGGIGEELSVGPDFKLKWQAGVDAGGLLAAAVFPDFVEFVSGPLTSGTSLEFSSRYSPPRYLLGNSQATRLESSGVSIRLSLEGPVDNPEIKLYLKTGDQRGNPGIKAVIPLDESDGFIKETVNRKDVEFSFDIEVIWSNKTGLSFNGGSSLDILLPLRIPIGPLTLQNVHLTLDEGEKKTSFTNLELRLGTEIQGKVGPVFFVIDQLGFTLQVVPYSRQDLLNLPPGQGPVFGNLDLQLGFTPPKGIGLKIDTGPVVGGGFLSFEPDNERYVGILQLEFQDIVTLTAVGLLTTKLPGGKSGFSLLIIISSEGFTPIQLGFGFTLNGVGGLLGLNRTMKIEALRAGIKNNTLDNILFPKDPIANAARIISDLQQVFPPEEGRFVFGPMAQIGWGTPTLITIEMALALEIPHPIRLALLGVVKAVLPDEKAKLLTLQVNFLGTIEFEKEQLSFDASLYESRLLSFPLAGDMALRLNWGKDPNFLLTVGGFHPAYNPPPMNLPAISRIIVNLLDSNNPRLRLESYFAVTSNTVQFGSRVELYAASGKFNVYGFLGFDVLFQFNPFHFIAQLDAGLALRVGTSTIMGVHLSGTLEGPTPWIAQGKAKFKIWIFSYSVKFNKTFGERRHTSLPDIAVLPLLRAALQNKQNWQGKLPSQLHILVTVKDLSSIPDVLVHPFGTLVISEKVVPLKRIIDKFGNVRPADANRFEISDVSSDGISLETDDVPEQFAPAQFEEMTDSQRLARKSFEKMKGGVRIKASDKIISSYVVTRDVEYEEIIIDRSGLRRVIGIIKEAVLSFKSLVLGNAVARSALSHSKIAISPLAPAKVSVVQEGFSVVSISDLILFDGSGTALSQAEAFSLMKDMITVKPELKNAIQVIPDYEVNRQ